MENVKPLYIIIGIIILGVLFSFRQEITTLYHVEITKEGTVEKRVPLPDSIAKLIRIDSWEIKEDYSLNKYIVCNVYNGTQDWSLSSMQVALTTNNNTRIYRLNFHNMHERYDNKVSFGNRQFLHSKSSGTAVGASSNFVGPNSVLQIHKVHGWRQR